MKTVTLHYDEVDKLDWINQNCTDYTVLEYAYSPYTFEKVPYKIQLCTERDEVAYALRWL